MIEETPCLTRERRHFYETMLEYRYEFILERAYLRISKDDYDDAALDRIGTVSFKDEGDVWNEYLRATEEVGFTPGVDEPISGEEETDIDVDHDEYNEIDDGNDDGLTD